MNGDVTHVRIGQGALVKKMMDEKKTPQDIVTSLYIRCLSRKPSEAEIAPVIAAITKEPNDVQGVLEDAFWALLNSKEFMFNH